MGKLKGKILIGKVLVKEEAAETKTTSGLYIPQIAQEKPMVGTVVMIGDVKPGESLELKIDDSVLYGKYAGTKINIHGDEYLLMLQSDILYIE